MPISLSLRYSACRCDSRWICWIIHFASASPVCSDILSVSTAQRQWVHRVYVSDSVYISVYVHLFMMNVTNLSPEFKMCIKRKFSESQNSDKKKKCKMLDCGLAPPCGKKTEKKKSLSRTYHRHTLPQIQKDIYIKGYLLIHLNNNSVFRTTVTFLWHFLHCELMLWQLNNPHTVFINIVYMLQTKNRHYNKHYWT